MWFLGMDVGTGGTRAVIVDAGGRLISGASSAHAAFRVHAGASARRSLLNLPRLLILMSDWRHFDIFLYTRTGRIWRCAESKWTATH